MLTTLEDVQDETADPEIAGDDEFEDFDTNPTAIAYDELRQAFDHFDWKLFGGRLPECLITLQRRRSSYGHFSAARFRVAGGEERIDEIALNPQKWRKLSVEDNLSTLVHEMVHLEQHHFGKPSRRGYHNKEWAAWMDRVGLIPSTTGKPDGRRTGQSMSHYIQPGGRFEKACAEFLALGYGLTFHDLTDEPEGTERQNKTK